MKTEAANKELPVEKLYAENFLSLHNFEYKVNQFNVITGDIASGKSLIVRALDFFCSILNDLLAMPYGEFIQNLEIDFLRARLIKCFDKRLRFGKEILFDITYSYSYKNEVFKMKLFRDKSGGEISLESEFMEEELNEWKDYIKDRKINNHNEFSNIRYELYDNFSKKFGGFYPIEATFVPASRAALAIGKSNFYDYFLMEYIDLIGYLKTLESSEYIDRIHKILKAEIKIEGDMIYLISSDGRKTYISHASSGQQEIIYILLLLDKLPYIHDNYSFEQHYVFIEEPEAHLFPSEQKLVLELIAKIFNDINENKVHSPIRFFITTHSPYVLNTVNNMLIKGNIIKKSNEEEILNDERTKNIPSLDYENASAVFINNKGGVDNILEKFGEDFLINPDEINNISKCIDDNLSDLDELKTKLKSKNA